MFNHNIFSGVLFNIFPKKILHTIYKTYIGRKNHQNMKQIKVIARLAIMENKLNEFKQLAQEMIDAVREKEPGAIDYDWYLDELKMQCIIIETYADSKAVMAHVTNIGEKLKKMSAYADITIELFGNPDEEVMNLASNMEVSVYPYFSGL
jgi:quinol monooxygenase YgiN